MSLPNVDTAGVWDLVAYQGDTRTWSFSIFDNEENPINLNGSIITMTIKRQRGAGVPVVWEGSTTDGRVNISGDDKNIVNVYLDGDYPAGALVYDMQFQKNSEIVTYLTGQFVVKTEVTA